MEQFTELFRNATIGVLHGFDRIVFQGFLMPLMYANGAMGFERMRNRYHLFAIFQYPKRGLGQKTPRGNRNPNRIDRRMVVR